MLVERHALRRELPAQPIELLDQHDLAAQSYCGQRCADAAEPAADDQDFGRVFFARAGHGFAFALFSCAA